MNPVLTMSRLPSDDYGSHRPLVLLPKQIEWGRTETDVVGFDSIVICICHQPLVDGCSHPMGRVAQALTSGWLVLNWSARKELRKALYSRSSILG